MNELKSRDALNFLPIHPEMLMSGTFSRNSTASVAFSPGTHICYQNISAHRCLVLAAIVVSSHEGNANELRKNQLPNSSFSLLAYADARHEP